MQEPWYQNLTDEEIEKCSGDYIGCEICQNIRRCIQIKARNIAAAIEKLDKEETNKSTNQNATKEVI